ncbi:oxidoreductase [Mycobacterium sp. 852002-51971_SCH5477799-a]|uniref:SDR family NAD(P)-dependent oxidoreductase n=1 Tax=Mycobacterium sp. 852002-51971_SCH5477799-a TaxID=1834106 RepID=UPI0007FD2F88|nr:SDR family oxidoreductase [Mycobacterium sp. 852002-51971_SCH5477799-a]OBF62872.1 oxidoreductase [Mycobacterium sp. 852002-51971_SCH5477799-a]
MNQRVALVTGAAGGQGWSIAKRLRDKGFSVAACDLRTAELVTAVGEADDDGPIALELDVTSPEQWQTVVAEVVARFGSLSTLVNCAGVLHRASLTEETPDGFETAWRVNCLGSFLGMRAALEQLLKAPNASIVNICSTGAIRPFPQHSAYGSSKWALRGLTQTVAAELAPSGVRVNAIFPGPIATSMLDAATQARLVEASMFGRIGEADEVADAVAFLVSDEASFITGSELVIDGGQCLQIR